MSAENLDMSSSNVAVERPQVGEEVMLVGYRGTFPFALYGTIQSETPFKVQFSEEPKFEDPSKILAVISRHSATLRTDCVLLGVSPDGAAYTAVLEVGTWNAEDRRRSPRFPVQQQLSLDAVIETPTGLEFESHQGVTQNLSLCGAYVECNWIPPVRTLIRWSFKGGVADGARGLAIIARASVGHSGFGLEFIDFNGPGRSNLESLLNAHTSKSSPS